MLQPPVIIVEGDDILMFESADAAERYLEPVDVAAGTYSAYDAEGRKLEILTDGRIVQVLSSEQEPSHQRTLVETLHRSLSLIGDSVDSEISLPNLVERARVFRVK